MPRSAKRSTFGRILRRKVRGEFAPGFYIRFRHAGTEITRWAGPDRKTAAEVLARLMRESAREDLLKEKATTPASFAETEEGFRSYLKARHGETTVEGESGRVARIVSYFGPRPLRSVDSADVAELVTTLREEGRSLATCNRYLACLGSWFAYAIEKGYARGNPVEDVPRGREELKAIPFLGDDDVAAMIAKEPDPLYAAAFRVFADTGVRRSEFGRLERSDYDAKRKALVVRRSKARIPREIALTDAARDALDVLVKVVPMKGTAPVWTGSVAMISRRFAAAATAAGFSVSLHALRHSCASRLAQRSVPLPTIGAILGHKSWRTTARYAHHVPAGATEAAMKALSTPISDAKGTQGGTQASAKASG